jgi:hypothetical protein
MRNRNLLRLLLFLRKRLLRWLHALHVSVCFEHVARESLPCVPYDGDTLDRFAWKTWIC